MYGPGGSSGRAVQAGAVSRPQAGTKERDRHNTENPTYAAQRADRVDDRPIHWLVANPLSHSRGINPQPTARNDGSVIARVVLWPPPTRQSSLNRSAVLTDVFLSSLRHTTREHC